MVPYEERELDGREAKHLEQRLLKAKIKIDDAIKKLKAGEGTVGIGVPWSGGSQLRLYKVGEITYKEDSTYTQHPPGDIYPAKDRKWTKTERVECGFNINFPPKIKKMELYYEFFQGGCKLREKEIT